MRKISVTIFLPLFFNYAIAQNPSLVADVKTTDKQIGLYGKISDYNGSLLFNGLDNDGLYIWKTDGTTANTIKITEPSLHESIIMNGLLYYLSSENTTNDDRAKLFVTDGTQAGTHKITDKVKAPHAFIIMDDILYFEGADSAAPYNDLWRSDGTDAGTSKVFDYTEDTYHYFIITASTVVGGKLFFALGDWLYTTDGTTAGTTFVLDLSDAAGSYPINKMVTYQDEAYFFTAGTDSWGLWHSDGTIQGTQMLKEFNYVFNPDLSLLDGKLIMVADDGIHGAELWISDGTESGTTIVTDIQPGSGDGLDIYAGFTPIDNEIYFVVNHDVYGKELWKSDGTANGTLMVKDIVPGISDSSPKLFTKFNDKVAFIARDSSGFGILGGLFITDGTDAGTHEIVTLPTSAVSQMVVSAGKLFFVDQSIWVSDGTADGTYPIPIDLNQNQSSSPYQMAKLSNGKYLFNAYGNTGNELWTTDGILAGSQYLITAPNQYNPIDLCPNTLNAIGFFSTQSDSLSFEDALWKSDGTVQGTFVLKEIEPDFTRGTVVLDNVLYFAGAPQGTENFQLWRTDGTEAGTYLISNMTVDYLTLYNNQIYFSAGNAGNKELWKSDGTAGGTQLAVEINPSGSSKPSQITAVNGKLFFSATTDPEGEEPWVSDGTTGGTYRLKDIYAGNNKNSSPDHFTLSGDYVYFSATNHANGNELWRTDGTTAGTQLVKDIEPGDIDFSPDLLVDWNGTLFFASTTSSNGEIWRTHGDEASTIVQVQVEPGYIFQLANINNLIYGIIEYGSSPAELWRMDTTFCHNVKLDFFPEVSDEAYKFLLADGNVEFMAINGESTGQELWKYITQPLSSVEICNNIDDDCNGIVDDNVTFPSPLITFDGNQICVDSYTTYHWYLNAAPISGATDQCYAPVASGMYAVLVTDSTGCDGWSEEFPIIINGIEEYYAKEFLFYPNPASTYLWVQGQNSSLPLQPEIAVIDLLGREIFSGEITSTPYKIDISSWINGLYIVCSISEKGKRFEGKFLKQ